VYTRGCRPEQFRTVRLAVAGGQKLVSSVADAFQERFDLPLCEGYGCTELTPVVSVNLDDVVVEGVIQHGTRAGAVGRPLPGLSIKVADRETLELLPDDAVGIVLVRGPSVMMGYLDAPEATAKVVREGWYVTGDLGLVDEDGFLHIHDRVSRFSKIAGEMIPHAVVENAMVKAVGSLENNFAVLSAPDRVRGERLVVIYDGPELDVKALVEKLSGTGMPNLWIPLPRNFARVEAVPLLASGKLNLMEARRMAEGAGLFSSEKG